MDYLARGFADVDAAADVEKFAGCLKLLLSLNYFQKYKQKTFDLLQITGGDRVLEVGCGGGEDAIALAGRVGTTGRVVALDSSRDTPPPGGCRKPVGWTPSGRRGGFPGWSNSTGTGTSSVPLPGSS
ncbi:MAG: class I SAM-dependent methyltransferase [Aphanocapsa lilacina HA4352-LM1]|jgi:SAM-dependent methyltransferase|nr:class I SAM-dependent methyltransferase [Aphanocapsa lilacina HA4352-LM1]